MPKKKKRIKVFHGIINYGTQAGLFSRELRNQGVIAFSAANQDQYKRTIDTELLTGGSIIIKVLKHSLSTVRKIYWFFKYNTFHFYFGKSLFINQIDLPLYKFFGKKVIMEYLGYDVQLYQYSINKYEITNVRYYYSQEKSLKDDKKKLARLKSESRYIDKKLVCAPCYSEFVPDSTVLPLAIDINEFEYSPKEAPTDEIVIMHAPTSRGNKGTEFILNAVNQLIEDGYPIKMLLVENVTHAELKLKYLECDIFIDQILGGWYGTATIEAMALGRPTVCFIRESYFEHIDYGELIPIINAQPATIYQVLKETIENKHLLPEIGKKSREFVEEIHDVKKITSNLIKIYEQIHGFTRKLK